LAVSASSRQRSLARRQQSRAWARARAALVAATPKARYARHREPEGDQDGHRRQTLSEREVQRRQLAAALTCQAAIVFHHLRAQHLSVEQRGELLLVRIVRLSANAIHLRLLEWAQAALEELRADPPGAVVVAGSDGFFSAGVALKVAPTLDRERQDQMVAGINPVFAGSRRA
jgi:hypothetical protein